MVAIAVKENDIERLTRKFKLEKKISALPEVARWQSEGW
jgi:hypothetical protein